MWVSRRAFLHTVTAGSAGTFSGALIAARGREALVGEARAAPLMEPAFVPLPDPDEIRLSSNENPLGPGQAAVDGMLRAFDQTGRYPFNSRLSNADLKDLLAREFHAQAENIVLGAGSTEILRCAVRAFTSAEKALVTADPTFGIPAATAQLIGSPVISVPVDSELKLDLEEMAAAARGAGLVFLCNPNNPTGAVHSFRAVAEFVSRVQKDSPHTAILIDEAYHDYVTHAFYRTAIPWALTRPGAIVSRTFSKAYGMAGLRVGYGVGHKETVQKMARYTLNYNVNVLAIAAAMASFNGAAHIAAEKARNAEARDFTRSFFESLGYQVADSQTNFIFVKIGFPAAEFREACRKHKVEVGRDFPPLEKTHARISIGTREEMQKAVEVFQRVLGSFTSANSRRGR